MLPDNRAALAVGGHESKLAASKRITKDVAEIVEDTVRVEGIGKDGLGLAGVQAVTLSGDLEGAAASLGVTAELLAVAATVGV